MSTPNSPGWYPAPDGVGDQWWNGVDWSDARRPAGGTPPPPVVPPSPTVIYSASNPAPQSPAEGGPGGAPGTLPTAAATIDLSALRAAGTINARPNPWALYGLVAGIIAFFFNLFLVPSIVAITLSVRGLRRANELAAEGATTTLRNAAVGGIALGIISAIVGLVQALLVIGPITISLMS